MGDFTFISWGDLKNEVLEEIPWGGFGLFVDAWYLCTSCNMDYNYYPSFLYKIKKFIGVGLN